MAVLKKLGMIITANVNAVIALTQTLEITILITATIINCIILRSHVKKAISNRNNCNDGKTFRKRKKQQ